MEEQWPPNRGLPAKSRYKKAKDLEWGETPFDDLDRGELLRLVQAYHAAALSADSVLHQFSYGQERHPYWSLEGVGGRARARLQFLIERAGDGKADKASESIYRSFFRTAYGLLFPPLKRDTDDWGVNDKGIMIAPFRNEAGYRRIKWSDLLPKKETA